MGALLWTRAERRVRPSADGLVPRSARRVRGGRRSPARATLAVGVVMSMIAVSCGGDDDSASDVAPPTDAPAEDAPVDETGADDTTGAAEEGSGAADGDADASTADDGADDDDGDGADDRADGTDAGDDASGGSDDDAAWADDPRAVFPSLGPPAGEPILIGLVNTEGVPGLDVPEMRRATEGAVEYLGRHGGMGDRPIELVTCVTAGSPETSQSCAQEMAGSGVELVLLGLDLFPDYATYSAAGIPVVGVLPILPGDYTADARFLTGGSATVMAATAAVLDQHFGASQVGIVSADNAGSNASLASLTGALDGLGIGYTTIKGGDNETDAGFQGLVRQISGGSPDVLVSLYDGAGCIGMMRARASLGLDVPVVTTSACATTEVLEQVGDDADGWVFVGAATPAETPANTILREIMGPVIGVAPDEVDPAALGLGNLALFLIMTIAVVGQQLATDGVEVTGLALAEGLDTVEGLQLWPGDSPIECGAAPAYPTVCSFVFPVAEYVGGGEIATIPGLDALSSLEFLP